MCTVSRDGNGTGAGGCPRSPGAGARRTSITLVTVQRPGWMSAMPRPSSLVLTPRRFSATRATPPT